MLTGFWGEQPPFTPIGVGGGNFLITKSDAFGSPLPQARKRQHVGNQINAAFVFARANFVNMFRAAVRSSAWLDPSVHYELESTP